MSNEEIEHHKQQINEMTQEDMARLWRFAPSGHPYFDKTLPLWGCFEEKFKGFTPAISKALG